MEPRLGTPKQQAPRDERVCGLRRVRSNKEPGMWEWVVACSDKKRGIDWAKDALLNIVVWVLFLALAAVYLVMLNGPILTGPR